MLKRGNSSQFERERHFHNQMVHLQDFVKLNVTGIGSLSEIEQFSEYWIKYVFDSSIMDLSNLIVTAVLAFFLYESMYKRASFKSSFKLEKNGDTIPTGLRLRTSSIKGGLRKT